MDTGPIEDLGPVTMVTQKGTPDSATTDSGLCPHLTTSIISDARPHCCDRYRSLHRRRNRKPYSKPPQRGRNALTNLTFNNVKT
ncbi:hypothetical protein ACLB2K_016628 [Fragaria x ananassa]